MIYFLKTTSISTFYASCHIVYDFSASITSRYKLVIFAQVNRMKFEIIAAPSFKFHLKHIAHIPVAFNKNRYAMGPCGGGTVV